MGEFKRGDMYLRDMKNTKGHTSSCTYGQWHPSDRHTAMTSSTDGTVRVWDCERIEQKMVIKPSTQGRVPVTACCYNADGSVIAGVIYGSSTACL
jgi:WD repeat-containing protein 70